MHNIGEEPFGEKTEVQFQWLRLSEKTSTHRVYMNTFFFRYDVFSQLMEEHFNLSHFIS